MAKQRVVIEITPTRLEVALLRGAAIADSRALRLELPNYSENWPGVLDSIQPNLASIVNDMGIAGAQAIVLYAGPTAATGVFSCAEGAGTTAAAKAARLALAEAAGFALESNPHDLEQLTTDKPASGDAPRQVHTLGIADTEPTAQALAEWVTRSGLEPLSLIPVDVPGTVAAVDAALRISGNSSVALVLFTGEHGSALAAASAGRLRFIRPIAIGTESLVTALAREFRTGDDGRSVTLSHEEAARLICSAGIPERSQVFDAQRGVKGDVILPLVQPILQRCVVDIKQSMRFGLEEKERESATLHGIGPGSRVPRLMSLIAEQTGLTIGEPDPGAKATADGNIATWLSGRAVLVNLLPRGLRSQRTERRMRRAMWVGVGVALSLIGADTVTTRLNLAQESQATTVLRQRLEAATPATLIRQQLTGAQAGLAIARQHAAAKLSSVGDWDAAMVMISRQTPSAIRLTQVQFGFENEAPTCRITGRAPLSASTDSNASLREYMDALSAAPIVRTCLLGATQRGEGDQGPVQNFELTLVLVGLPSQPRAPGPALGQVGTVEDQR